MIELLFTKLLEDEKHMCTNTKNLYYLFFTTSIFLIISIFFAASTSSLIAQETQVEQKDLRQCFLLSRNLKGKFEDKKLQTLFTNLDDALKNQNPKKLLSLFHPRLQKKFDKKQVRRFFNRFDLRYGKKHHINHYRTWSIQTPNGDPQPLSCQNNEFEIFPAYGFTNQALLWFNLLGDKELGKIAFQAVEREGDWVCLLYTSPSPRDQRGSRMPSSA